MSPDDKIRIILLIDQIPNLFFWSYKQTHFANIRIHSIPVSRHATSLKSLSFEKAQLCIYTLFCENEP